jgi:hypothetical protein
MPSGKRHKAQGTRHKEGSIAKKEDVQNLRGFIGNSRKFVTERI